MKKNYDIRFNPKRLSKEEVDRHKDFDALLRQYRPSSGKVKPLYRRMAFWMVAAAAAAALALLVVYTGTNFNASENDYAQQMSDYFTTRPFIDAPLDNVKPTFASYEVDVNQGGVFEYPSGSKLIVPVAAFTHEDGSPVTGEVTIKYREMHDFVDFFLSGIPMTYDSAGVRYTLESAGMIEIFAEQDGQKVNMAPDKSIDVELVSHVNMSPQLNVPPGYNIYKLDEEKRNWVYQNVDKMEMVDEDRLVDLNTDDNSPGLIIKKDYEEKLQAIQVSEEAELTAIEASYPKPKKPVKPTQADVSDYVFDLDFDDLKNPNASGELAKEQAELAEMYSQYEKMLWQLSADAGITSEELRDGFKNVSDIAIKKLDNRTYELTLQKADQSLKIKVNPVLSGSDYEKALADFNRDMAYFNERMQERETALQVKKDALNEKIAEEKRLALLDFEEKIAELQSKGHNYAATEEIIKRKVVNRFTARGFGIWNCDRPIPPDMLILTANFKSESGNSFTNKTAYLVDKSRNTVYRFLAEDGAKLNFNRNSQNLLWLITDDNKIAVFRPEDFKGIEKDAKTHEFVMQKIDKEIKEEKDVRDVLYL
ncbi:MAG: hypothetical protein AAFZ15_33520 [Bacteroidota bacterium]